MTETKTCQNCKNSFGVEDEDFAFYKKIDVPAPTWCWECRLQRRMMFRNERTLYKRKCNVPGHTEEVISVFSPENAQNVYDQKEWWGDSWDGTQNGKEIDFSKPFLEQVKQVWQEVPDMALLNIRPVNSDYCSITEGNKNCYLVVGGDFNEGVLYSGFIFNSKDSMDTHWVSKSEHNYETVDCIQCFRLKYSRYCEECYDSAFLFNCKNCHDCFGCVNLMNKSHHIFNVPYSKEEYAEKMKEINLGSSRVVREMKEKFQTEITKYPRRFVRAVRTVNSTGDNLEGTKNCKFCFEVFGAAEDCRYIWLAYSAVKDCFDCDHFGLNSENSYEVSTIYPGSKVFFSRFVFASHDVYYSYNCHNCHDLFGCIGLRDKQYCILNRQYSKEEYEVLVPKIIGHMNSMPYKDKKDRVYKYGEFFPAELSPFSYNETIAQEYFPLSKEKAEEQGYLWKEPSGKHYDITVESQDLPDRIQDVKDDVLKEVIGCEHKGTCNENCTTAFKIIEKELQLYRVMNVPLPKLCPNCRHYQRISQRNPLKLWHRTCQCTGKQSDNGVYQNSAGSHPSHGPDNHCVNEFETSYAPDRKEIVYCEQCYQSEVV